MQETKVIKNDFFQAKKFSSGNGEDEHFFIIKARPGTTFAQQIETLEENYSHALAAVGIKQRTAVYRRFFLSDIYNQMEQLRETDLFTGADVDGKVAVSAIQQSPLCTCKIMMLAYHIDSKELLDKVSSGNQQLLVRRSGVNQLWFTNLAKISGGKTADEQTRDLFNQLIAQLDAHDATLLDNTVRTWVYVRDVDRNYKGMVDRRRELFKEQGLTKETHYISSTGIEGSCEKVDSLVSLDALSLFPLDEKQVSFLNAYDNLCDTIDYNVTFERGTKIQYRDRAHLHISGTASIDKAGNVLHPGDVVKQTIRTLENVRALLEDGGAILDDLMYLIVYLRDIADMSSVKQCLDSMVAKVPFIILEAPVCRPDWLIEVEGVAVIKNDAPGLADF